MIASDELVDLMPGAADLPRATMDRVAALATRRRYVKGATLYRAGDAPDGLYIVMTGRVRVARETETHAELLHFESVGGVLGEIPVLGGGPFPATATAVEPTVCAHLPLAAIEHLLNEDAAFARFAIRRLAERARGLLRRIDELTATTITARVAAHVLSRAARSLGKDFALGMSQEQLAHELGTAREVVVRALRSLIASGAIERSGRSRFVVRRLAILKAIAAR